MWLAELLLRRWGCFPPFREGSEVGLSVQSAEALVKFFRRTSYDNFVAFTEQMFRGAEECEKRARDFLRERDGFVSTEAMQELVFDIWNTSKELKNS